MMADTLVLYIESMPCEVGAAALASLVYGVTCVGYTIQSARLPNSVPGAILNHPHVTRVIVLGNYWSYSLPHAIANHPTITFNVYNFGEASRLGNTNCIAVSGKEHNLGPAAYIVDLLRPTSQLFDIVGRMHTTTIQMLDDRIFNRNISENQLLFSGLYNHPSFELGTSNFVRFQKLFSGLLSLDEILKVGKSVVNCQLGIAYERATKNTKIVDHQGIKIAMTEAPELLNLTHDELHRAHQADVTVCVNWKFGTGTADQLAVSVRSLKPAIDAELLVKQQFAALNVSSADNGGNASAAGGRMTVDCPFKF